jgi:DNA-binding PadR family transcriptional regulator
MKEPALTHRSRSPEYALLGFLCQEASYGYDLHRTLITELGEVWHISQSQTYSILKRLESKGLITSTVRKQNKLPAQQLLRITAFGRRCFRDWLAAPTRSSVRTIRLEFITRLYFASRHPTEELQTMIDTQSSQVQATLAKLETKLAGTLDLGPINRLSLQLRLRQLRSVQDWLQECRNVFTKQSA